MRPGIHPRSTEPRRLGDPGATGTDLSVRGHFLELVRPIQLGLGLAGRAHGTDAVPGLLVSSLAHLVAHRPAAGMDVQLVVDPLAGGADSGDQSDLDFDLYAVVCLRD